MSVSIFYILLAKVEPLNWLRNVYFLFYVIRRNRSTMFPYLCSNGLQCCYPFVSVLVTLQFNIP